MAGRPRTHLVRVGKRGTLVIPAAIRTRLGITEGQLLELSNADHALLIQPVLDSRLERFREAFGPFFEGVDPVEFQRGFRDETTQLQRARTPGRSTWLRRRPNADYPAGR